MGRAAHPGRYRTAHAQSALWLGVFLLFAPIGFLLSLCPDPPWTVGAGVCVSIFSGAMAIAWMYAFRERRYWLILPLAVMPVFAGPVVFAPLTWAGIMGLGSSMGLPERRITLAVLAVVSLALGFTIVIRHVRRTDAASFRWKAELDLGQKIHERLVSPIALRTPRLEIVGRSSASAEMGGDLLDLVNHDGRIDLLVGDVSGHGVAAGVVMAMVRGAVRSRLRAESPGGVDDLMRDLSRIVAASNAPELFATMAAVRMRDGSPSVEIALAGHNPVLWWRAASGSLADIENESLPLGVMPDETYTSRTITPEPGDWLIAYTDGLVEVFDATGHQFGMDGIRSAIREEIPACARLEDLVERVISRVRAHGPVSDDQTIAAIRFLA